MGLSFREKSAWGMLAGILVVSSFYFPGALRIVEISANPLALLGISIAGVVAIVIIATVYHALIAVTGSTESDERDALIDLKAERVGSVVLGAALFMLVAYIVAQHILTGAAGPGALRIVVLIIAAQTMAEVAKLVSQILYYRLGN